MGITGDCAKFLIHSLDKKVDFDRTLMLGRQQLFISKEEISQLPMSFQASLMQVGTGAFAEPFFKLMGANVVDSMDYSDFEQASIIHDLNVPVSELFENKYSVVFDGGTLEHVFNFPVAVKNCMDMLKVGGHFVAITPTNNYCGHGFYQFSPELFFALFNEKHGFKIKLVALGVEQSPQGMTEWYEVKSPHEVKRRVTLRNEYPSSLVVIAVKEKDTKAIQLAPFQSDYAHIWAIHDSISNDTAIQDEKRWIYYYRKFLPNFIKDILRKVIGRKLEQQKKIKGLGITNPAFFKKMDL